MRDELIGETVDFKKIIWLKEVGDADRWAYMDVDEGQGEIFKLHWPNVSKSHPQKPAIGELIVLKQHKRLTHLVIPYSNKVVDINESTRWPYAREVICLRRFNKDEAPLLKDVFPFSTKGGSRGIGYALQSFINSHQDIISLEGLQKNIWRAFFDDFKTAPIILFPSKDNSEVILEEFPEGKIIEVLHKKRERSPKLV